MPHCSNSSAESSARSCAIWMRLITRRIIRIIKRSSSKTIKDSHSTEFGHFPYLHRQYSFATLHLHFCVLCQNNQATGLRKHFTLAFTREITFISLLSVKRQKYQRHSLFFLSIRHVSSHACAFTHACSAANEITRIKRKKNCIHWFPRCSGGSIWSDRVQICPVVLTMRCACKYGA